MNVPTIPSHFLHQDTLFCNVSFIIRNTFLTYTRSQNTQLFYKGKLSVSALICDPYQKTVSSKTMEIFWF